MPSISLCNDHAAVHTSLQQYLKWLKRHLEEGHAVLPLMEAHVVRSAYEDAGTSLLPYLILPALRERLENLPCQSQVTTWR